MPNIVCVNCQVEYQPSNNGVHVIETFLEDQRPYKIWYADEWKCPKCDHRIVTGYGRNPLTQHFDSWFESALDKAIHSRHVFVYENRRSHVDQKL